MMSRIRLILGLLTGALIFNMGVLTAAARDDALSKHEQIAALRAAIHDGKLATVFALAKMNMADQKVIFAGYWSLIRSGQELGAELGVKMLERLFRAAPDFDLKTRAIYKTPDTGALAPIMRGDNIIIAESLWDYAERKGLRWALDWLARHAADTSSVNSDL